MQLRYLSCSCATLHYMDLNPVSFRWSDEKLARVDAARGDVPRSVWVWRAVEARLALVEGGKSLQAEEPVRSPEPEISPAPSREDVSKLPPAHPKRVEASRAKRDALMRQAPVRPASEFVRAHSPTCKCALCS